MNPAASMQETLDLKVEYFIILLTYLNKLFIVSLKQQVAKHLKSKLILH